MHYAQQNNVRVVTLQHRHHTLQVSIHNDYRTGGELLVAQPEELYANWLWEWRNGEGSEDEVITYDGREAVAYEE